MITDILTINTLESSGTEVFLSTIITMMLNSYDAVEAILTHMKNNKLAYFNGFCLLLYINSC